MLKQRFSAWKHQQKAVTLKIPSESRSLWSFGSFGLILPASNERSTLGRHLTNRPMTRKFKEGLCKDFQMQLKFNVKHHWNSLFKNSGFCIKYSCNLKELHKISISWWIIVGLDEQWFCLGVASSYIWSVQYYRCQYSESRSGSGLYTLYQQIVVISGVHI